MSYKYERSICLDFDAVVHRYTTPWIDTGVIPDDPVSGAKEFMAWLLDEGYSVLVLSSRCMAERGVRAIEAYLAKHELPYTRVLTKKEPALLYVDDRGYRFGGNFEHLKEFISNEERMKPWNRKLGEHSGRRERLEGALEKMNQFEDGTGIDWGDVETVFALVRPLIERELTL